MQGEGLNAEEKPRIGTIGREPFAITASVAGDSDIIFLSLGYAF